MFAIIGASGNVGRSTSSALRQAGVPVRAILHDSAKGAGLREQGCEIAVADLQDSASLVKAIRNADTVQVIIPLRPQTKDPAGDLRLSGESIINALRQTHPKRVLAISDYGAHVSEDIGMPSIFHEFEALFHTLDGHKVILRSAEHTHNWGRVIPVALASGTLPTFQDSIDKVQPTISAQDLGLIAAKLLLRPESGRDLDVIHAEGPRRYSASDVATALSQLSGRTIHAQAVPRSQWTKAFEQIPGSLADLLIKANEAKNKGGLVDIEPNADEVIYGTTGLTDALRPLLPPQ
ncbi:NmrA family NAD(P)-binding protein [Silvibacterium acidisoli]|uniref:NmrA family NAD(P)-binding protein n=1 Tax=Acidobacteriaceae bacterium ZG23-2 TaxID=2883246 RepID=UPI00406D2A67